jgi:hypothetical protein
MALVASPPAKGDYVLVCKLDASWTEKESATVCMAGYIAYPPEPPIVSILRERIYLIDQVAVSFFPTKTGPVS